MVGTNPGFDPREGNAFGLVFGGEERSGQGKGAGLCPLRNKGKDVTADK